MDGNVLRIWMRYFAEDSCIDDARVKKEVTEKLALVYKKDTAKALTEGRWNWDKLFVYRMEGRSVKIALYRKSVVAVLKRTGISFL